MSHPTAGDEFVLAVRGELVLRTGDMINVLDDGSRIWMSAPVWAPAYLLPGMAFGASLALAAEWT